MTLNQSFLSFVEEAANIVKSSVKGCNRKDMYVLIRPFRHGRLAEAIIKNTMESP